jgi:hypothetical protein
MQLPSALQLVSGLVVGLRARAASGTATSMSGSNTIAALTPAAKASGTDFKSQILGAVEFGGLLASVAQLNGLVSPQVRL